jgi:hypothetical protein
VRAGLRYRFKFKGFDPQSRNWYEANVCADVKVADAFVYVVDFGGGPVTVPRTQVLRSHECRPPNDQLQAPAVIGLHVPEPPNN